MGRRGPEGDVTGSGPGGRNRAAAAAVAQRRAAEAPRAGAWTVSSTPGYTSRQPETTQRRTRGPGRCRCRRHGALPPFHLSPATWSSSRPRPPQVSGAQLWSRCGCPSRATAASPSCCCQPRSRCPQLRSSLQGPVRAFAGPHCPRLKSQVCASGRGHGTAGPGLGRATLNALGLEAKAGASAA